MGGGSYISIVRIALFFLAVWLGSKGSQKVGISTIVAEILIGVVLGPQILGLMPQEYAECEYEKTMNCELFRNEGWHHLKGHEAMQHVVHEAEEGCAKADMLEKHGSQEECLIFECEKEKLHHCSVSPNIFTLLGHIGVSMMIFEAGMHVDFQKVKLVGAKACCVAVIGTFAPIILGTALIGALGYDFYPNGLAVGIALSPTSIGISLKLLGELGVLDRFFGQAIIVAAVVDDVLALIAYCLFFALAASSAGILKPVILLACGVILMLIGAHLACRYWPQWMEMILVNQPTGRGFNTRDRLHLFIMWIVFLAYATAFHFMGSHLWGCFIAGMSFTAVPHSHHIWVAQTKRMTKWMLRVFFACTVGFAIPIDKLLTIDAFLKGMLIGAIPCLGAKVFCAPFMGDAKWVIGWGMCGRAEFAYLIAQMALSSMLMTKEVFSICIWSLLCATIIAPLVFRVVLNKYTAKLEANSNDSPSKPKRSKTAMCGIDAGDVQFSEKDPEMCVEDCEEAKLRGKCEGLENRVKELEAQLTVFQDKNDSCLNSERSTAISDKNDPCLDSNSERSTAIKIVLL